MDNCRRLGYRPALDGVRAVAILAVVCRHGLGRPVGGFLGVHIFFVLSGFLITTLLLEEWDARGAISLRHFYYRRALRLFPALALALVGFAALTAAVLVAGDAPAGLTARGALRGGLVGLFYVSNFAQSAGIGIPAQVGHLWSLAAEEQFYLLWPISLLVALRLGLSRRTIGIGLAALVIVLALHRLEMTMRGAPWGRLYFRPDGSFDLLLIGCLAGLLIRSGSRALIEATIRICRLVALPAAGFVALMLATANVFDRSVYEVVLPLFGLAIGLLLLFVALDERSLLARGLSVRPLVYLGRISYGIYLWHEIVTVLPWSLPFPDGRFALDTALTLTIASASYYLVETRFLRRKRRDREQLVDVPVAEAALAPM